MKAFSAKAIFVGELPDLDVYAVIFAEHEDGSGRRLELARSLSGEFDEQDAQLGMDTYSVSTEEGVEYGAVSSWCMTAGALEVTIAPQSRAALATDTIKVSFHADSERRAAIELGIHKVLGDH